MSLVTPARLLIAVAVIGLAVGPVVAQQPGQGRGGFGGFTESPGQQKLRYLGNEAVQKELELANDQKADVKKLSDEAEARRREGAGNRGDFQNLSQEEREKRFAELRQRAETQGKETLKKIEAVLLPHQMDRLQQIYVQVRGVDVLSDADVAKELALNDKQKEQLTAIRDDIRQKMFQGGQGGFDRERFAALTKERDDKSLAVLTAEQKAKYEKMKGEAFAEAASLRFGGGRGGAGGRPGGEGGQGGQGGQPQRRRPGGDNPPNN